MTAITSVTRCAFQDERWSVNISAAEEYEEKLMQRYVSASKKRKLLSDSAQAASTTAAASGMVLMGNKVTKGPPGAGSLKRPRTVCCSAQVSLHSPHPLGIA